MQFAVELTGLTESVLTIVATVFGAGFLFLWIENR